MEKKSVAKSKRHGPFAAIFDNTTYYKLFIYHAETYQRAL